MTQEAETRIDVRDAIAKARDYIRYLYSGENQTLYRLMLEEVKLIDDKFWIITFGFDIPPARKENGLKSFGIVEEQDYERTYRDIWVDSISGEVIEMRTRKV